MNQPKTRHATELETAQTTLAVKAGVDTASVREPEKGSEALGNEKREKIVELSFLPPLCLLNVPTTCLYIHDTGDHHHRSLYPHYAI